MTFSEKLHACQVAQAMMERGLPQVKVAERLGVPCPTLSRVLKAYRKGGPEALKPQRSNSGRPPKFRISEDEANALRYLTLEYRSLPLAIERFVQSQECRPETRELMFAEMDAAAEARRPPRWPKSLRDQVGVTPNMEAAHKGPKHVQNETEFSSCKLKVVRTENGEIRPMMVNEVFQSDDYSTNVPYIIPNLFDDGVAGVGRQMLATVDEYSYAWKAFEPIGRERDAYRAEDIARHMLRTIDAAGTMPAIWVLERGRWENNLIDGIPVVANGRKRRWGALRDLFNVERAVKSRGKAEVEGAFNLMQSKLDPEGLSVGRWRGEREAACKLITQIHSRAKPWTVDELVSKGLWTIQACADMHARCAEELNRRPKQRRGLGYVSAADLVATKPHFHNPLPESERWRFCTVKREATVRRAHVQVQVKGYELPFRFVVNAGDVHLCEGYRVLIAFDPLDPEAGCHIFNNQTDGYNTQGYEWAEFIKVAEAEGIIPAHDYSGGSYSDHSARKGSGQSARSEYRAIKEAGKKALAVSQAHDGRGNSVTLRSGVGGEGFEGSGEECRQDACAPGDFRRSEVGGRVSSEGRKAEESERVSRVVASIARKKARIEKQKQHMEV
ncbi:MAG: helix-turn-helix domain-containing protein [Kiritimatiellae bacterium]|nr:helix-turn-helix domain-containing protein [Kiritimatiellia bacterium]